jgi:hypothetical protein
MLAHGIAHNLVDKHDLKHEFYVSAICGTYLEPLIDHLSWDCSIDVVWPDGDVSVYVAINDSLPVIKLFPVYIYLHESGELITPLPGPARLGAMQTLLISWHSIQNGMIYSMQSGVFNDNQYYIRAYYDQSQSYWVDQISTQLYLSSLWS